MIKLCACGCGTKLFNQHNTYIVGHNTLGSKQSKETIKKRKQTQLKRYGVEHSQQSANIRQKSKHTLLKNFGVSHPLQSKVIKEKSKSTILKNYGVTNASKSPEIQDRKIQTSLKRYGVTSPNQCDSVKEKKKLSYQKHFNVDHWSKSVEGRQIHRESMLNNIQLNYKSNQPLTPVTGKYENGFFKELQKYSCYTIVRPNKHICGYFPDGYIDELKLIIEFDEKHHRYTKQKEHDIRRDIFFRGKNYVTFRVSQHDWFYEQEKVLNEFKTLTKSI